MRGVRRASQAAAFILFLFLFLKTEYRGEDVIPYAVNVFLRLDPLVAAAAVVSGRVLIGLVWPALLTVALTILLGRFFCGWVCPLGSVIDAVDATLYRKARRKVRIPDSWRRAKYLILVSLLASSLLTLQLVFLFDPISLLIRSLAVSVYPAANLLTNTAFDALYRSGVAAVTAVSEPVYAFLKEHVLVFRQPSFARALPVGLIFVGILALSALQRRFWCRNLCPLGAMFGLISRVAYFRRRVAEPDCTSCRRCVRDCRMGAIAGDILSTDRGECIECLDCRAVCPEDAVSFAGRVPPKGRTVDLTRRSLILSAGAGLLAVPLAGVDGSAKAPDPRLVRPPGALPEKAFLSRCTRCGECMRVCVGNGLHPAFLEGGVPGLFSPVLVPRLGYCEINCTLCGQVCPTGAIARLSPAAKKEVRLGLAEVNRSHCLPWKGESECIVCEEHCPTDEKAITLVQTEVVTPDGTRRAFKLPYVVERRCIGCGICENKCPLTDRAAITVTSRGESRAAGPGLLPG